MSSKEKDRAVKALSVRQAKRLTITVGRQGQPAPEKRAATRPTVSLREDWVVRNKAMLDIIDRQEGAKADTKLDRLAQALGEKDYRHYLLSKHWENVQCRYRRAWSDCRCIGCDAPRFALHHVTYARMGREKLSDLLPLCSKCHRDVHRFHRCSRVPLENFRAAIREVFGWDERELSKRLTIYESMTD